MERKNKFVKVRRDRVCTTKLCDRSIVKKEHIFHIVSKTSKQLITFYCFFYEITHPLVFNLKVYMDCGKFLLVKLRTTGFNCLMLMNISMLL